MTDEIIESLPEKLRGHRCKLKKASYDDANKQYMCESNITVIHFDKIPNEYTRGRGWSFGPKSNDALYIDKNRHWYFIEFKNGGINTGDIYRKIYDSLLILLEWRIIPNLDFVRSNITYILVYNEVKYGECYPARNQTYNYIAGLAQKETRLFGIDKFEQYLFYKTHTYTKEEFNIKFVQIKEQ